jgi:hypothetical protein
MRSENRCTTYGFAGGIVLSMALMAAAVRAADPIELRYSWESGARYGYETVITADHGEEVETLQGTPILQVESVSDEGARIKLLNHALHSTTTAKNPARVPFRFPSPPRIPSFFEGHELTLDARGRVINQRGESQLPFVLGNLAQLLIEPFPADAVESWTQTESTSIRITSEWPPRSPFRRDVEQERLNAEETTTYTVQEIGDQSVSINKEYKLETVEAADGKPRMELSGSGELTFDRHRSLLSSLNYEGNFIVREDNTETKYPITIKFRLLTDDELAEHDRQAAEQLAAMKAPPMGEQRATMLADLTSGDINRGRKALIEIQPREPAADQTDAELAAALAQWLESDDQSVRHLAAQALEKWGTAEEIPELLTVLADDSQIVVNSAMRALGRLHATDAIETLVARLAENQSRLAASEALKAMGADAEEQTLTALDDPEWTVRLEACRILEQIGTEKSVERLRAASSDDENALIRQVSKQAADTIEAR